MSRCSFLLAAGGQGKRLGGITKQFRELQKRPLWLWSVMLCEKLFALDAIHECIVVIPLENDPDEFVTITSMFSVPLKFVKGGITRRNSVLNGLHACNGDKVLIHDAARPFLSTRICRELIESTNPEEGAIPFLRVSDALKEQSESSCLLKSINRERYILTQTPQSFYTNQIIDVLEHADENVKDEAEAWINEEKSLNLIQGDPLNFKITYEKDWDMAEYIALSKKELRTGIGYDIHPLIPGRPLILAGIHIPEFPLGLSGHSDADVVAHAVSDSILGAAGLPDIGILFPSDSQKYKDADSMKLLSIVINKVISIGWKIQWIDIVINAQKPVLAPFISQMKNTVGSLIPQVTSGQLPVNIKVKSGEKTGSVGNLECIKCFAVTTLLRFDSDESTMKK